MNNVIASNDFWKILKNPSDFEEELNFYKKGINNNCMDLKEIVINISAIVRKTEFWSELLNVVNECKNADTHSKKTTFTVARRLKNDYISELDGQAKKYCIEISQLIDK